MHKIKFEQPKMSGKNSGIPPTLEVAKQKFAEGLDKDPRVQAIQNELVEDWEQSTREDILSPEGQDFLFGDSTARKTSERSMTVEQRAQKIFTERFPEEAKAYAEKERTRIYENPDDDPAIRKVREKITRITNQDVEQIQKGMWGEGAMREANGMGYDDVWNRNFNRINIQQWDEFLSRYPEKAAAYREKFEPIKRAFERQERLQQYPE